MSYVTFPIAEASLIFIRHWETHKVSHFTQGLAEAVDADVLFCMRHCRMLNDQLQGLAFEGWQHAEADGRRLFERGVRIARLEHSAGYQRNIEGCAAKLRGYTDAGGEAVAILGNPAGTCPIYDFEELLRAVRVFGKDYVIHRWMSGYHAEKIATENSCGFQERIHAFMTSGIMMAEKLHGAIVFDGNFEQSLMLWTQFVDDKDTWCDWNEMPSDKLWQPRHGYCIGFRGDPDSPDTCEYDKNFEPIECP